MGVKAAASVAAVLGLLAITACLYIVPFLLAEMQTIREELADEMSVFKVSKKK
jgi:hypothetical protein